MNRGFGFLLSVPILFLCFAFMIAVYQVNQEEIDLEEYVLTYAIDYSTDAAVEEMLEMSRLDPDYDDDAHINIDPEHGLDTFLTVMALNYDFPLNEKAKGQIEAGYIPVFCVAAYDGYYIFTKGLNSDGDIYLQSSPKLPYSYEKDGSYYSLNLGAKYCYKMYNGRISRAEIKDEDITKTEVMRQINTRVSDDLMYRFQQETGRGNQFVYIPTSMTTIKKVNAIEGPSVLAFIDEWDIKSTHKISAFSIGGAQLTTTRWVAGYKTVDADGNESKWYCYADILPAGIDVIDLFTSPEEAASHGYYYDPNYMG